MHAIMVFLSDSHLTAIAPEVSVQIFFTCDLIERRKRFLALSRPCPISPRSPTAARDQSIPALAAHHLHQSQRLPPINGPGTKSGPYSGYASKAWLQGEFRQDLDELRRHVDEYVSKREQRAFDLERTALKAEIGHLQKRLAETEAQVVKLQTMLPDEEGEFKSLRAELDELERVRRRITFVTCTSVRPRRPVLLCRASVRP
ncbi:hypothetical protein Vafri_11092 [Volvox africanus]|uniref:Uncharacterized protein n=1 Tax=Volvox africanus TaxID=51714 RepID=A0A8J4F125_9CHLO|nr:hypothetical protein Vafri_11092 [Volvox africanus]